MEPISLFGIILLRQLAIKSAYTYPGAIELPHDEPIFLHEITNGRFLVLYLPEPLVLLYVPFYDLFLSLQDLTQVPALFQHNSVSHEAILFFTVYHLSGLISTPVLRCPLLQVLAKRQKIYNAPQTQYKGSIRCRGIMGGS
jgi:hypothetical protein